MHEHGQLSVGAAKSVEFQARRGAIRRRPRRYSGRLSLPAPHPGGSRALNGWWRSGRASALTAFLQHRRGSYARRAPSRVGPSRPDHASTREALRRGPWCRPGRHYRFHRLRRPHKPRGSCRCPRDPPSSMDSCLEFGGAAGHLGLVYILSPRTRDQDSELAAAGHLSQPIESGTSIWIIC